MLGMLCQITDGPITDQFISVFHLLVLNHLLFAGNAKNFSLIGVEKWNRRNLYYLFHNKIQYFTFYFWNLFLGYKFLDHGINKYRVKVPLRPWCFIWVIYLKLRFTYNLYSDKVLIYGREPILLSLTGAAQAQELCVDSTNGSTQMTACGDLSALKTDTGNAIRCAQGTSFYTGACFWIHKYPNLCSPSGIPVSYLCFTKRWIISACCYIFKTFPV